MSPNVAAIHPVRCYCYGMLAVGLKKLCKAAASFIMS